MNENEIVVRDTTQPTPPALLQLAIEKGVQMDQLEKLMDLAERWDAQQAKKAFLGALSRFQTIVPVLKKNKKADIRSEKGAYSYTYADLGSITGQIKKALKDCGLSYRWEFSETAGKISVTCLLSHRAGHTEKTIMEAMADTTGGKNAIQQKGSTNTYLQRYTLIGVLGLSTADEDNDGKGSPPAGKIPPKVIKKKMPTAEDPEYLHQWTDAVNQVNNRAALQGLYLKNKKTVDEDKEIQLVFKTRQEQLPPTPKNNLP